MKHIPDDSISSSLESLAYVFLFISKLEKCVYGFNWDDKTLQTFLLKNDIQTKEQASDVLYPNEIYLSHCTDKAYGFLNHIKNSLINGLVFDSGFDYEFWDIEPSVEIDCESSLKHKKDILTQIATSQIAMKGIIRKYLFWQFITAVIRTNKNI